MPSTHTKDALEKELSNISLQSIWAHYKPEKRPAYKILVLPLKLELTMLSWSYEGAYLDLKISSNLLLNIKTWEASSLENQNTIMARLRKYVKKQTSLSVRPMVLASYSMGVRPGSPAWGKCANSMPPKWFKYICGIRCWDDIKNTNIGQKIPSIHSLSKQ